MQGCAVLVVVGLGVAGEIGCDTARADFNGGLLLERDATAKRLLERAFELRMTGAPWFVIPRVL